jgi:predicted RNA-binding Zn-ribbon protein involved in translation (DUF1610 family)
MTIPEPSPEDRDNLQRQIDACRERVAGELRCFYELCTQRDAFPCPHCGSNEIYRNHDNSSCDGCDHTWWDGLPQP